MADRIRTSVRGPRGTVTLDRPDLHNAFDDEMIEQITAAFAELGKADPVRVIVLSAEGKSFCAGADVNWMRRMVGYTLEENVADAERMAVMLRTVRECPKPVIARIHGAAYGGGVGLAAACDLAVALESAAFCLSEVNLGIIPAVISPYVMEKIGPGHLRRLALTAERFSAEEARRIGLVNEAAESIERLDEGIERFSTALLANGPQAIAACKAVLRDAQEVASWDARQALTVQRIAEQRVSPEGQEGLKAFLEKRRPAWGGRGDARV